MLNLNFVTPKRHLRETTLYEPSCVKISSVVFPVEDSKKKKGREGKGREGKGKHKKSRKRYISPIRGKPPVSGFSPNFAHQEICRM